MKTAAMGRPAMKDKTIPLHNKAANAGAKTHQVPNSGKAAPLAIRHPAVHPALAEAPKWLITYPEPNDPADYCSDDYHT